MLCPRCRTLSALSCSDPDTVGTSRAILFAIIRLKEAAFDAANKDSRNIMAGTAGPVPMIPAMTDDER